MNTFALPSIITCGYFDCIRKFGDLKESPKRIASAIEIELYLEDGYSTYMDGTEYPILKNHIFITKAGTERYSLLPFKTVFLKITAVGELENILNSLPSCFPAIHVGQMIDLFNEIILLHEEKNPNYLLIGAKLLMLVDLLRADALTTPNGNPTTYSLMHEAKKYMSENLSKKISSEDIAASVNLSESRFRFLFKNTYGISAHQHLINIRILAAKQMLWDNTYSMSEIAEKCGFGCQQYFNEIFKRETGISPGKYKTSFERKYNNG